MIIRRLELQHFGRFESKICDFSAGVNLIGGPNEAGKSTLMEAIPAILFGVRDKERFRPWGRQGSCSAALVLETPNRQRIRIEREILTDRVTLVEEDEGGQRLHSFDGKVAPLGRSSERELYLEHLDRLFGHADEELFRASLFFGQGSLEIAGDRELATRIKAILSGSVETDYDQVLAALSDDYFTITRENPWGKDKSKDRELEEVRQRIAELETRWYQTRDSRQQLEQLQQQSAAIAATLEQQRNDLAEGRRYLDQVRKHWQLQEKEATLKRDFNRVQRQSGQLDELLREERVVRQELERLGLPAELPASLPQWLAEAETIRKGLVALQAEATAIQREIARLGEPPWRRTLLGSAALIGAGGVLAWAMPAWQGRGLFVGGLLSLLLWTIFAWRAMRLVGARNLLQGRLGQVELRRAAVLGELSELEETFRHHGLPASAVEMVKLHKNLTRHGELVQRLKELESALRVLDRPEEVNNAKSDLSRELVVVAERLETTPTPHSGVMPTPQHLPELEGRLQQLAEAITVGEGELLAVSRAEAALRGSHDTLHGIEEEGEVLREREMQLERRKAALALGCNLLRESVNEFRRTHIDRFADDIGQYLGQITRGKYEQIRLDDGFLPQLAIRAEQWQPLHQFSRGTGDAVYLAVRLALSRHLTQGRHLPLLLDDPFVHLDRQRLSEALKVLERICRDHQVLVFSHSETLLRKAERDGWRIIDLDEARPVANIGKPKEKEKEKEKKGDDGQLCFL